MARVTVEDCIRYYPNRFEMVYLASRRARQLLRGMPPLLEAENEKPTVQALREMGEGLISWDSLYEMEAQERARLQAAQAEEEGEDAA